MGRGKVVNLRGIPEELVRRAHAIAAIQGKSMKQFLIEVITKGVEEAFWNLHEQHAQKKPQQSRGC